MAGSGGGAGVRGLVLYIAVLPHTVLHACTIHMSVEACACMVEAGVGLG